MKRVLLLTGVAAVALLGGLLLRAAGPAAAVGRASPVPRASVPEPTPVPMPSLLPAPARDVFRYADDAGVAAAAPLAVRPPYLEPPPPLEPPAPEPVKLVGFVRRGGVWHAALSVHGDVVVLGKGEASGGYQLVALDEAEGVTVRDAQSQERRLSLPEP